MNTFFMKPGLEVIQIGLRERILFVKHFMILFNINNFVSFQHNGFFLNFEEKHFGIIAFSDAFNMTQNCFSSLRARSYKDLSAHKYCYFFALIAVSIPCIIAVGVGGQPLTTTSTGMMLETLP